MQNPDETRSPIDNEVDAPSQARASVQDEASDRSSHSTPPPKAPPREIGGPSGPGAHALRGLGTQGPLHRLLND